MKSEKVDTKREVTSIFLNIIFITTYKKKIFFIYIIINKIKISSYIINYFNKKLINFYF